MYQIERGDILEDWLAGEPDPEKRLTMLEWMVDLATDPLHQAHRVPGVRPPVYLRITPVRNVTLTFLHVEQFHVVKLIEFGTLP